MDHVMLPGGLGRSGMLLLFSFLFVFAQVSRLVL